jgi:hypothetical protein
MQPLNNKLYLVIKIVPYVFKENIAGSFYRISN